MCIYFGLNNHFNKEGFYRVFNVLFCLTKYYYLLHDEGNVWMAHICKVFLHKTLRSKFTMVGTCLRVFSRKRYDIGQVFEAGIRSRLSNWCSYYLLFFENCPASIT